MSEGFLGAILCPTLSRLTPPTQREIEARHDT
jgi:hypothetical protein